MRIAFYTLGCKVNQYETEILIEKFSGAGYDVVASDEEADVYVVNSCTVTAGGDKKTRQVLRRFKRAHPGAKVALTGCVPQAYPAIADELPEADIITGAKNRAGLVDAVARCLATGRRVIDIEAHTEGEAFEEMRSTSLQQKTRAFVKIEDGCDRYCAYCIIPTARGPVRSKNLASLREELLALSALGYREVVLAGINLSLYGTDLGHRLTDAVDVACGIQGLARVRLGSVEPELLTPADIEAMAKHPNLCPQFHLSLQSGCDKTLRRMNRHYTTDDYREIVRTFRRCFKNAAITTDIIVGFPGETDEEFAETMAFAEEMAFARTHVFSYSKREGTAAAIMDGQVPNQVKEARSAALTQLSRASSLAFYEAQVGQISSVLIEAREHRGFLTGHTPNYTPVVIPTEENLRGELRDIRILSASAEGCVGEFV